MFGATTGLVMFFEIELETINSPVFVLLIQFKRSIFTIQLCVAKNVLIQPQKNCYKNVSVSRTENVKRHSRNHLMKCTWTILNHENH